MTQDHGAGSPHGDPRDVLDARDPAAEPGVSLWLRLQRSLALAPQAATDALRSGLPPAEVLHRLPSRIPGEAADLPAAKRLLASRAAVLVPFGSRAYPWRLAQIPDAAPVLSVIGDVSSLHAPAVAVVGSRAATAYGRGVARRLAADLAGAGLVIVSGLAHGIDGEAHRAALEAGGRTVAVQASGPDHVYPARHRGLAREIAAQGGALVSELPPGTRPRPAFFPLRNRLIAGLARALLVVEARERSGSLTTVRHALAQGADVFVVPGPITAASSEGTNRLLREGATPVLSAEDILEGLGWKTRAEADVAPTFSDDARRLLSRLQDGPASRDDLVRGGRLTTAAAAGALLELELAGRISRDRDGRFRVVG